MSVGKRFSATGEWPDNGKDFGGNDEAFYDGGVDRFRESGSFSGRSSGNGETPETRVPTLSGNSLYMAARTKIGGRRKELRGARRYRKDRQGSFCGLWFERPKKGIPEQDLGSL